MKDDEKKEDRKTVTIVQGEDRSINFQVKEIDSNDVTTYLDISNATEIEIRSENADASAPGYVSFSLSNGEVSVVDGPNGMFKLKMSDVKTSLLKIAKAQNLEVIVDIGSDRRIAQLFKAITIVKRLFP